MIASLDDAWRWYETARRLARTMQRLGDKHWNTLPWEGDLGRDDHLNNLTSASILDDAQRLLDDLDDLCVLLLFSVFEATLRERTLLEVEAELPSLRHVAIKHAIAEMRDGIEQGNFFRVLEPYKDLDASLVEEVNAAIATGSRTAGAPPSLPRSIRPPLMIASNAFLTASTRSGEATRSAEPTRSTPTVNPKRYLPHRAVFN